MESLKTNAQSQTQSRHGLSLFHTIHKISLLHTTRNTTEKSFLNILTDKKVVLSHRCLLSSPKEAPPLNYLPLIPNLCGPRLQRPTVSRQRIRSVRGMGQTLMRIQYTERHRTSGQPTSQSTTVFTLHQSQGLCGSSHLNVTA